jgi:GDP-D-mannose dehydratase
MIKRNIIISGALGQDGKILTNLLNKKKYNIIGIVKKLPKITNKKLICIKINLSNYKKVNQFVNETNPLAFIHFGSANPSFKQTENNNFYYKNLLITKNLINCFIKLKKNKLILVGSSQMYSSKIKKINLNSKFKYKNSYAKFRIDSYKYMKKIKSKFNSNIVMAILFNHDSVHRNKKFLIPRLIKMIKNKKFKDLEKIYKENISSDFSHAEDICSGLNKLIFLKKNPDKLIFSSNKRTHVNDIIKFLLKENKIIYKFNSFKTKMILPIGDNSLTRSLLNWKLRKNIFVAAKNMNSISYKKN